MITFVSQAHHAIVVDVRVQVGSQSVTSAPPQRKVARQHPYQRQRSERSASALAHGCESDLPRHLLCEHLTVPWSSRSGTHTMTGTKPYGDSCLVAAAGLRAVCSRIVSTVQCC